MSAPRKFRETRWALGLAAAALRRHVPLVTYKRQDFLRTGVLLCDTRPC